MTAAPGDPVLRDRWRARADERISEAGLRSGAARTRVLDLLATDGQCLIGAREIVERLAARAAGASQASVYRVLDELTGLGLVRRSLDDAGLTQYEIDDDRHHHHHFIDDDTGAVTAFDDDALEEALAQAARRLGVELTGHDIVLRGRRLAGDTPAR